MVKQTATAKFDETIEVSVRLGLTPPYGPAGRGRHRTAHGTGKTVKVLVFAKGDKP